MGQRPDLHDLLAEALGSENVYFQPPEGFRMKYPCIVYELEKIESSHANNKAYHHDLRYSVTVIDKDPESAVLMRIADFPKCSHDRHFVSDNLHHNIFTLYY